MSAEVELKLSIDRKHCARLHKLPAVINASISKPLTHKLTSIYFDTPDLRLLNAGITLRIRHKSKSWIQTIKLAGTAVSGLHERPEWEDIIAADHPDFTKIRDKNLAHFFSDQKLRDAIVPVFQTEIQRCEWQLAFDNDDKIELALDSGLLTSNKNQEPISEIELELKAGNTGRLFDFALELQSAIPLTIQNASKAERGYAYYRTNTPQIHKSRLPALHKHLDANYAFKQIAWECINHLQSNQDIVLQKADEEGIHQMRIALRRLRSAFILFRKILGRKSSSFLLAELNWLSCILGKARDVDVFTTQTLPTIIECFKTHQGLLILRNNGLKNRLEIYTDVHQTLLSRRYQHLLLTLSSWLKNERWREGIEKNKNYPLLTVATFALNKFHKRLLRHNGHFSDMQPDERHAVRIAVKKQRYAAEFFADLYPTKDTQRYIKRLTELQEYLGQINDIDVSRNLTNTLAGTKPSNKVKEAIHIIEGWNASSVIQIVAKVDVSWQELASIKPFWV